MWTVVAEWLSLPPTLDRLLWQAMDLTQNNFSNFVSLKALYTLGRIV